MQLGVLHVLLWYSKEKTNWLLVIFAYSGAECETIHRPHQINFHSWPKVLGTNWQLVTHYFKVGFSNPPNPLPPPPLRECCYSGFTLGERQHCVGGGKGEVNRNTICWQKCKVSQDILSRIVDQYNSGILLVTSVISFFFHPPLSHRASSLAPSHTSSPPLPPSRTLHQFWFVNK